MHLSFNYIVSSLAVITTILQFLSGILVCKQYVANKTTAEAPPLPFICGIVSSVLWLLYGLTKQDDIIVLVNTIGVTLMVSYTIVFYIYTIKKTSLLKQILAMVIFLLFVIIYVATEEDNEALLKSLGLLASGLTLLTVAAPMSKLVYVLRVRNTQCLPFPMILMSFFVSTLWFIYGIIELDPFLMSPNLIGGALALFQLSLFVKYPSAPLSPVLNKTILT